MQQNPPGNSLLNYLDASNSALKPYKESSAFNDFKSIPKELKSLTREKVAVNLTKLRQMLKTNKTLFALIFNCISGRLVDLMNREDIEEETVVLIYEIIHNYLAKSISLPDLQPFLKRLVPLLLQISASGGSGNNNIYSIITLICNEIGASSELLYCYIYGIDEDNEQLSKACLKGLFGYIKKLGRDDLLTNFKWAPFFKEADRSILKMGQILNLSKAESEILKAFFYEAKSSFPEDIMTFLLKMNKHSEVQECVEIYKEITGDKIQSFFNVNLQ